MTINCYYNILCEKTYLANEASHMEHGNVAMVLVVDSEPFTGFKPLFEQQKLVSDKSISSAASTTTAQQLW